MWEEKLQGQDFTRWQMPTHHHLHQKYTKRRKSVFTSETRLDDTDLGAICKTWEGAPFTASSVDIPFTGESSNVTM